ncbi:MAG: hypothetical protein AAGC43_07500 [Bacteroidota bacterium]
MKIFLKAYRVLTYIFLALLIVGLCLSIYEYFIEKQDYGLEGLFINIFIICFLFIIRYFLAKTKDIYLLDHTGILDKSKYAGFKFDKATGILNFIIGLAITSFPIFIFLKYPINQLDAKEISRISILVLIGIYGILKINYTTQTLKMLLDIDKT